MIAETALQLLKEVKYEKNSKYICIAKGKNKLATSIKEMIIQIKRSYGR
jgi:hypothetical protein